MEKIRIGIIFGGQSAEHEVSLMSASSIIKIIDKSKFDVLKIGITKDGRWHLYFGDVENIENGQWINQAVPAFIVPDPSRKYMITLQNGIETRYPVDVFFPVLHGPRGEDGTLQGIFELMNIPYVSCGVTSSALCMDKVYTKKILKNEGLPVADFKVYFKKDLLLEINAIVREIEESLGFPCFVKPANLGSSIGITKAHNKEELKDALFLASEYDTKIIVEKFIPAREIEVSVLGNENPIASLPGEIIPSNEFYDYTAKYFDGGKSKLLIPAPLAKEETEKVKDLAVKAFKALDCSGMARVDFLLSKVTGIFYINELNTIPGFTKISMYPKLWEASGLSYRDLIEKLIELAFEKYREKQALKLY